MNINTLVFTVVFITTLLLFSIVLLAEMPASASGLFVEIGRLETDRKVELAFGAIQSLGHVLTIALALYAVLVAVRANRLSQQALKAQARPWVSFSTECASPLTWCDGSARIDIAVEITNHGGSPALDAQPALDLRLIRAGDFTTAFRDFCEETMEHYDLRPIGVDVFPDKPYKVTYSLTIKKEALEKYNLTQKSDTRSPARVGIVLFVSIQYRSPYDDEILQAYNMWGLMIRKFEGEGEGGFLHYGKNMLAEEMELTHLPIRAIDLE